MDVIVVDEEHRQPIQRPALTVVIDVFSLSLQKMSLPNRINHFDQGK